jgi:hypothetical protein
MALKLDEKTGVYHYTTDSGFHLALVAEGAMDYACKIKDETIESQAKEIEGLRDILRRVDNEFENLSNLDSPEIVSPNDKLWEEIYKLLSQGTTTQPDKGVQ